MLHVIGIRVKQQKNGLWRATCRDLGGRTVERRDKMEAVKLVASALSERVEIKPSNLEGFYTATVEY